MFLLETTHNPDWHLRSLYFVFLLVLSEANHIYGKQGSDRSRVAKSMIWPKAALHQSDTPRWPDSAHNTSCVRVLFCPFCACSWHFIYWTLDTSESKIAIFGRRVALFNWTAGCGEVGHSKELEHRSEMIPRSSRTDAAIPSVLLEFLAKTYSGRSEKSWNLETAGNFKLQHFEQVSTLKILPQKPSYHYNKLQTVYAIVIKDYMEPMPWHA